MTGVVVGAYSRGPRLEWLDRDGGGLISAHMFIYFRVLGTDCIKHQDTGG